MMLGPTHSLYKSMVMGNDDAGGEAGAILYEKFLRFGGVVGVSAGVDEGK